MFHVIPAIDILNGQVVRLTKGDYGQVQHYTQRPEELARYYESNGAKRLHIVDLDGAKAGTIVNRHVIEKIRSAVQMELEFGGGIRTPQAVSDILNLGVDYAILGSILVKNTDLAVQLIEQYPHQIIAGLDMKQDSIAVEGWIESSSKSLSDILSILSTKPIASIIYTDIDRDGTLTGPNLVGLRKMASLTQIPIIASGGVSNDQDIADVSALSHEGILGCIVGKAFLNGTASVQSIAKWTK